VSEIDEIIKKLNEQETIVKKSADIWSIGSYGSKADKAAKKLIKILFSEESYLVRSWAAWSLGRIGGKNSRKALEKLISNEVDEVVQTQASNALEWLIKTEKALEKGFLFKPIESLESIETFELTE
jgi:HEAT repeat protein